jgi:hypothetical protein
MLRHFLMRKIERSCCSQKSYQIERFTAHTHISHCLHSLLRNRACPPLLTHDHDPMEPVRYGCQLRAHISSVFCGHRHDKAVKFCRDNHYEVVTAQTRGWGKSSCAWPLFERSIVLRKIDEIEIFTTHTARKSPHLFRTRRRFLPRVECTLQP